MLGRGRKLQLVASATRALARNRLRGICVQRAGVHSDGFRRVLRGPLLRVARLQFGI